MPPKITLLCVTRSRLPNLKRMVTSFISTVGCDFEIVVGFDDDFTSYNACPDYPRVHKVLLSPRHYYVRGANALYHFGKRNIKDFGYFVLTGDDTEFIVTGWGPALIAAYERDYPEGGVVDLVEPNACAHFFSHKDFYDSQFDGLLWPMEYTMYNSDTEMVCRLRQMGRLSHMKVNISPTQQRAVMIHHLTKDAMRDELSYWSYWDKLVYGIRAKQHGWPLAQSLDAVNDLEQLSAEGRAWEQYLAEQDAQRQQPDHA